MTLPRANLVDPDTTPYYHCISRCVRRAFLCGADSVTGRSFEHRRGWIVERLAELSRVFAVDVCAYAVMSNHHHLVMRLNPRAATGLSDREVLKRWCELFTGPVLVRRFLAGERLSAAERDRVGEMAETYRARLCDLSWFMRCLNEPIARWANAEDGCTGRFWEGRFKSQALLDEPALLACMAYVDLNPVRAGIAETPEASEFTSIRQRALDCSEASAGDSEGESADSLDKAVPRLLGFDNGSNKSPGLPFASADYLELVDWSGRAIHPAKKDKIPDHLPPILERLGIQPKPFVRYLSRKEQGFYQVMGRPLSIQLAVVNLGKRFFKGISASRRMFDPQAS